MTGRAGDQQDARMAPRSNVFLAAVLYSGSNCCPIRIRNVSQSGALVDGPGLPAEGSAIRLRRGGLTASGEVAWREGNQAGIRFHEPVKVAEWVRPTGHPGQRRVDMVIAAVRGDTRPSACGALPAASQLETVHSWSLELQHICERLVQLPNMDVRLAEELARIDAIAQAMSRAR